MSGKSCLQVPFTVFIYKWLFCAGQVRGSFNKGREVAMGGYSRQNSHLLLAVNSAIGKAKKEKTFSLV